MRADDPLAVAIRKRTGNNLSVRVGDETFVLNSWTLREGRLDTEWESASIISHAILEQKSAIIGQLFQELAALRGKNE